MTASWYQPKYASFYVNQMRFGPGQTIKGWHFDGRTNTWHTGSDIKILASNGASALFAGVAAGFAGLLAF